jgi:hypothetical protein
MGESSRPENVTRLLAALGRLLPRHGFACDGKAGVAAAERVYASSPRAAAS